jgi:hypothetical protein
VSGRYRELFDVLVAEQLRELNAGVSQRWGLAVLLVDSSGMVRR